MFTTSFCYRAYDLGCRSEVRLPELQPLLPPSDLKIAITIGRVSRKPQATDANEMAVEVGEDATWLSHPAVGAFRVCNGNSITVEPADGVEDDLLRLFLLGPALGTLLRQRGRLTLHASAVAIDGAAVVFVGSSGAGKSTMAAAFHARGRRVLADDIVAIDGTGPVPVVLPGFPQLKLDARTASATRMRKPRTNTPTGAVAKRYFPARRGFVPDPLPLRCVYVLADAEHDSIGPVQPHDALCEMLRHSYGARSLQALNRRAHFQQCAAVAGRVPVRRLNRRMALAELTMLTRLVEDDLAQTA